MARGRTLVSDGTWGTFLQKKGLEPGECPALWCVGRPADVLDIAQSDIDAGADMIEAASFGGTSYAPRASRRHGPQLCSRAWR
jgi:5-methyltetrahydrofolate--homocysteine methyltransferase